MPIFERKNAGRVKSPEEKKEARRYGLVTLLNTVIVYGIYLYLVRTPYVTITLTVYLTVLALLSFGYVFYNRGFTRRNLTEEQLPESWTPEEKASFLADVKIREKKSKWCLTLLIPFIATFFLDLFYLFIIDRYLAPLFGQLLS